MGCASCHSATEDGTPDALPGGHKFVTQFGTFIAPNISPHPEHGIGAWSDLDIASAVLHGKSPRGQHYYPAFPYSSYARATAQDIADLISHLRSLPPQDVPNQPHDVGFPFNIRASLGGWKLLFAKGDWVVDGDLTDVETRGRYLVEALGHCGECHTPRNPLGGLSKSEWLTGAPNPSGSGRIPGITKSQLTWSDADVAAYLTTGFTPEFDTAGGSMAEVVENLAKLPRSDVDAIVAYLRRVP
jgi:mono/diheme cytochrome c family protein